MPSSSRLRVWVRVRDRWAVRPSPERLRRCVANQQLSSSCVGRGRGHNPPPAARQPSADLMSAPRPVVERNLVPPARLRPTGARADAGSDLISQSPGGCRYPSVRGRGRAWFIRPGL